MILSAGCATPIPVPGRDPRLTEDCVLVPLPDGAVTPRVLGETLVRQQGEVANCNLRFRALR